MSSVKHTEGPWQFHCCEHDDGRNNGSVFSKRGHSGMCYCVCKAPQYQAKDQWIADARLIAAAPDMLAALERCLEVFVNQGWEDDLIAAKEARAAISKAKGEA